MRSSRGRQTQAYGIIPGAGKVSASQVCSANHKRRGGTVRAGHKRRQGLHNRTTDGYHRNSVEQGLHQYHQCIYAMLQAHDPQSSACFAPRSANAYMRCSTPGQLSTSTVQPYSSSHNSHLVVPGPAEEHFAPVCLWRWVFMQQHRHQHQPRYRIHDQDRRRRHVIRRHHLTSVQEQWPMSACGELLVGIGTTQDLLLGHAVAAQCRHWVPAFGRAM